MRTFVVALLAFLGTSLSVGTQDGPTVSFKVFKSSVMKIEFPYPSDWVLDNTTAGAILLSSVKGDWMEIGLPPSPHPWFVLIVDNGVRCPKGNIEKVVFDPKGGPGGQRYWESYNCIEDVEVLTGFWEKDPNERLNRSILEHILKNLRVSPLK